MAYYLHEHDKEDGRKLWLFSEKARDYVFTNDLPPVGTPSRPIRRMHPLRGEPVYFNPGRNARTLNPPADYNPLAPVAVDGYPGEIPVTDFEVAIFQNRWPGLMALDGMIDGEDPAYGQCEVVVYTPKDNGSLADLSVARIALLLEAIGNRADRLFEDQNINFVLPFENRGSFVGTTLPHPHGQIYAFKDIPPMIARQMQNAEHGVFDAILDDPQNVVAENDHAIAFCPPFARYPFEMWLLPKAPVSSPSALSDDACDAFADLLKQAVGAYDTLFDTPMPYAMWHAMPTRGNTTWPYHIQFWPLQRGAGKMKYLASVEQITGLYLSDVMPEVASDTLRAKFSV